MSPLMLWIKVGGAKTMPPLLWPSIAPPITDCAEQPRNNQNKGNRLIGTAFLVIR